MAEFQRIASLDLLRGVAISAVILFHLSAFFGPQHTLLSFLTAQGFFGVQLFFLVSAFTMCEMWDRRTGESQPALKFYIRRFFRIAGPFWIAIIFYRGLEGFGPSFWAPDGISARQVITTVFFVHALWPDTINCVVPGGWSIGVEMLFYLLFPLLIGLRGSQRTYLALAFAVYLLDLIVVRPAYTAALSNFGHSELFAYFLYAQIFSQGPVFLIGMALYKAVTENRVEPMSVALAVAWVSFAFVLKYALHVNSSPTFWLAAFLMAGGAYAVIIAQMSWAPLNKFGEISYSAYLSHFATVQVVEFAFKEAGIERFTYLGFIAAAASVFFLTWIVGLAMRHAIEKPSVNIGRIVVSILPTISSPPAGAVR